MIYNPKDIHVHDLLVVYSSYLITHSTGFTWVLLTLML